MARAAGQGRIKNEAGTTKKRGVTPRSPRVPPVRTIPQRGRIRSDFTRHKDLERRLEWHLQAERILSDLAGRLAMARDLKKSFATGLQKIRKFLQCDRVWLSLLSDQAQFGRFLIAVNRPDLPPWEYEAKDPHAFRWIYDRMMRGRVAHCVDSHRLPPGAAAERIACRAMGTRAFYVEPLLIRGQYRGGLILCQADKPRAWSREERVFVHTVGELLVHAWEHDRYDRALRLSEQRFRAVVKEAADAIFLLDARGRFLHVNPAGCRLLKRNARELSALTLPDVLAPSSSSVKMESAGTSERSNPTHRHLILRGDGTNRLCEAHARRMPDGRIVSIFRDATKRQQVERQALDAIVKEQQRIGRDLHDSLGQPLTGLAYQAEALRRDLAAQASPDADKAARICAQIRQTIQVARYLARGLAPVTFHPGGLEAALRQLADETSETFSVRVACAVAPRAIPRNLEMQVHLYQIICEAVNNAVKHGRSRTIEISLSREGATGRLTVWNDGGSGRGSKPPARCGMGLAVMQYRAEAMGGQCQVRRVRGAWEVLCTYALSRGRSTEEKEGKFA